MLILHLFLLIVSFSYGQKTQRKIVGGLLTDIKKYPYQAFLSVDFTKETQACGASIIDETTLLTAAHCIISPAFGKYVSSFARVGSTDKFTGGQVINVKRIIPHPRFSAEDVNYDIAVLKLGEKIRYNGNVQPISLASSVPPAGSLAFIAGWGALREGADGTARKLRALDMPIICKEDCKQIYKGILNVHKYTFCAGHLGGGYDTCQGDSGGPVMYNGKQIGIVSWGEGCARKGKVGIYTDVSKFTDFIEENM